MDYAHLKGTIDEHRSDFLDLLRLFVGIELLLKGVVFITDTESLLATMNAAQVPAASMALAHLIALAHLGGGLMLALGLATRVAAAVQIPIVLGAVVFVHRGEGLFQPGQSLELALLVLFLLVLLAITGGGRLSVDNYVARHAHAD